MIFTEYLFERVDSTLVAVSSQQEHAQFLRSPPHLTICTGASQLDFSERHKMNIKRVYPAQRLQRSQKESRMPFDIMIRQQNTHGRPASENASASSLSRSRIVCARCSASLA